MQLFPRALNFLPLALAVVTAGAGGAVTFGIWYYFSPKNLQIGYAPEQPIHYSHKLHADELGIDCRYCHIGVDKGPHSTLPATQTCMNCHQTVHTKSDKLAPVRASWETNEPVEWVKVHDLPDYVYFNHSAHVTRGVGCVSCHGRVDQMEEVNQQEPLSMSWCLDCHRNPEKNLRPPEEVTNMTWAPPDGQDPIEYGKMLREKNHLNPSTDCSTCHR